MLRQLLFHNFRIIYFFHHWVKRQFTKAGMLISGSLIITTVFGIDTRQTLAYQLVSLFFVLLLLAKLNTRFLRIHLTAQRKLPKFATVDSPLYYTMSIYNHLPTVQHDLILLEDTLSRFPSFETFLRAKAGVQREPNWFDNYVGYPRWLWLIRENNNAEIPPQKIRPIPPTRSHSQGGMEVKLALLPLRRGYLHFTGVCFAVPEPLGLLNRLYTIPLPDSLLILPKHYPVNPITLHGSKKYQRGGVQLSTSVGDTEEFVALREYRPGDPLRYIHWRSWAKLGKPVVKEFQDEFFVRHALILDTFTKTSDPRFEAAVSVAASFVCAPQDQDILLDLMFVGSQAYCVTSGRGLSQPNNLLEILACVDVCHQFAFSHLYSLIIEHLATISAAICILLVWDEERQQLIKQLHSFGIPLLVIVVCDSPLDDQLFQPFPSVHRVMVDNLADDLMKITEHF